MSDIFYSPDGQIIAVGVENTLQWFDVSTFKEIGSLQLGLEGIYTLAFSPDSQLVGVGSGLSEAQIVDLNRQTILATIQGRVGGISDLVFTPDSQYMAYRMGDRFYDAIGLWDIRGNKVVRVFEIINPERYYLLSGPAISPDGVLLAAGSSEKQVYIWNLASGQTQFVLDGHTAGITCVTFSPDG